MSSLQPLLGPTVREVRLKLGFSQERLAEVSGLDRSYVGEIERGLVSPTLHTLEKLAVALSLLPSELISRCEARRRHTPNTTLVDSPSGFAGDVP